MNKKVLSAVKKEEKEESGRCFAKEKEKRSQNDAEPLKDVCRQHWRDPLGQVNDPHSLTENHKRDSKSRKIANKSGRQTTVHLNSRSTSL